MASTRDGGFTFWRNGLPCVGRGTSDSPGLKFWSNGLPSVWPSGAPAVVVNQTLADLSLTATMIAVDSGTLNITLDGATISSATVAVDTTVHLDPLAISATAVVSVAALATPPLAPLVSAATAQVRVTAVVTKTLSSLQLTAVGWVNTAPAEVTQTLVDLQLVATGTVANPAGGLNITLDALTLNASIGWPATFALRPEVDDDGWGGALMYAWTQVSGPDTAVIVTPSAKWTDVRVPEVAGVYVFQLAVSRASDAVIGYGLVRVRVTTGAVVAAPSTQDFSPIVMTVNGVQKQATINSVHIDKTLGQTPRCLCSMYGDTIETGNDVVIERSPVRLFGGVCLELEITENEDQIFYHPSLVGYAWHLERRRVTKAYTLMSMSDIAADLLSMTPGGITGDYIQSGLPAVTITFDDVTIADAFIELTKQARDLHFAVDDFKRLHFAIVERDDAPNEWSDRRPSSVQRLTKVESIGRVANRVRVFYTDPVAAALGAGTASPRGSIVGTVALDATEIQVSSLDGYESDSDKTVIADGNVFHYTGVARRMARSVFGNVWFSYVSATPVESSSGELGPAAWGYGVEPSGGWPGGWLAFTGPSLYYFSLSTSRGETPLMQNCGIPGPFYDGNLWEIDGTKILTTQGSFTNVHPITVRHNAVDIWVLGVTGADDVRSQVTAINVYRQSSERSHTGDSSGTIFLIGSLPPRGGHLIDQIGKARLAPIQEPAAPKYDDNYGHRTFDEPWSYFLTGVTLVSSTGDAVTSARLFVLVDDVASQTALAARLGGADDGIVEVSIQVGAVGRADALTIGRAYLDDMKDPQTTFSGRVLDSNAQPGQVLDVDYPAPFGRASPMIQTSNVSGFEQGVAHWYDITASPPRVTLEDLLRGVPRNKR